MSSEAKPVKAPKICKCGHTRDSHMKNSKSRWQSPRICNNCPCSKYLNRKRPDTIDRLSVVLGIITAIAFTLLITYTITISYFSITEEESNAQISLDMTNGEFRFLLSLVLILVTFWFCDILFTPLEYYLKNKKRKNWPIDDPISKEDLVKDGNPSTK